MWTHIKKSLGMGLEEQHLLRWHRAPVCSLKERETHWESSLLRPDGLGITKHEFSGSLSQVKLWSEEELERMGWKPDRATHPDRETQNG